MKTIGVIPARWDSTRLPGKSLIQICGKPLIQWVVEGARNASALDDLMVATDDERILDAVEKLGVKAVMTRKDHPSGTDRIAEAVEGMDVGVIINIQGDEPLLNPGLIDRLLEAMTGDGEWDMATAAVPIEKAEDVNNPSVVKVVWGEDGRALYFSRSAIPFIRDVSGRSREAKTDVVYWRHLGIYAYTAPFLKRLVKTPPTLLEKAEKLEQLRALHIGGKMVVLQSEEEGIGVDTEEDVKYVERLLEKKGLVD